MLLTFGSSSPKLLLGKKLQNSQQLHLQPWSRHMVIFVVVRTLALDNPGKT